MQQIVIWHFARPAQTSQPPAPLARPLTSARFFIAKDFEKAMRKAVDGSTADLDQINGNNEFTWYKLLLSENGKAAAVLRIDGNSYQSSREYRLGH